MTKTPMVTGISLLVRSARRRPAGALNCMPSWPTYTQAGLAGSYCLRHVDPVIADGAREDVALVERVLLHLAARQVTGVLRLGGRRAPGQREERKNQSRPWQARNINARLRVGLGVGRLRKVAAGRQSGTPKSPARAACGNQRRAAYGGQLRGVRSGRSSGSSRSA